MKQVVVRQPNSFESRCCGNVFEVTMYDRSYVCPTCNMKTLYVPNTARGYYAVANSPSDQSEISAPDVQAV